MLPIFIKLKSAFLDTTEYISLFIVSMKKSLNIRKYSRVCTLYSDSNNACVVISRFILHFVNDLRGSQREGGRFLVGPPYARGFSRVVGEEWFLPAHRDRQNPRQHSWRRYASIYGRWLNICGRKQ